jgi:hypothetical protein
MEDWATFSTTLLPYILAVDGVPPCVRYLCAPLHHVTTFFVRYREGQAEECQLIAASKAALEYAERAEKAFRRFELATHQMHVVAVHLAIVARDWGPTAFLCEYWIERLMQVIRCLPNLHSHCHSRPCTLAYDFKCICMQDFKCICMQDFKCICMQDFKRCVKLRCTRQPELTAFMSYLYDMALRACKRKYPEVDRFVPKDKSFTPIYDEAGTACEVASVALARDHNEVRSVCMLA